MFICVFLTNPIEDEASLRYFVAQVVRAKERLEEELDIQSQQQEKKTTPET